MVEVVNDPAERRYEALSDGKVVGVIDYVLDGDTITLVHTIVPPNSRGKVSRHSSPGSRSMTHGPAGHHIIPKCPFVASYVTRHPETLDVIVEGWPK